METETSFYITRIIPVLAIIISIIGLAWQIRRSRIQSIKESMDNITRERSEFTKLLATHEELGKIVAMGLSRRSKLSPHEDFRFTAYLYYLFVQLELGFRKWKRGHIDKELWNGWNEAVLWWIRCPGTRSWWRNNRVGGYTIAFQKYINDLITKVEKEDPTVFAPQLEFLQKIGAKTDDKS